MGKIRIILSGIKKCGFSFIKYNFLKKNIIRNNNSFIFPYRGSIISLNDTGKIVLNGNLYFNAGKYRGSKAEAYLVIDNNALLSIQGDSRINYGSTIHVCENAKIEAKQFTTNVGVNFQIKESLFIGEDCMFGRNATIFDSSFHPTGGSKALMAINTQPVTIGNHVWIGANAFIMPGTCIGDGSIVGSQSYVSGNIDEAVTVSKNPEKPQMTGNIWARSLNTSDIENALSYYKDSKMGAESYCTDYTSKITELLKSSFSGIDFGDMRNLVQDHIIDSLTLIKIVTLLEESFNVKIPYTMISAGNFDSADAMSDLVKKVSMNGMDIANDNNDAEIHDIDENCFEHENIKKFSSILEALSYYSEKKPDTLCISDGHIDYTYRSFVDYISREATVLNKMGIKKGDNVVVEGIQSPHFLALEFALHSLGAVFVPLENSCGAEKLISIASRCGAKIIVSVDTIIGYESISYRALENAVKEENSRILELPEGNDISEILFSTGTTGKEKGIVLSHNSSVRVAENIYYGTKMYSGNIELIPSPLNHSHGLRSVYSNFIAGASVITLDNVMDVQRFFSIMDKYKVNAIDLVPTALSIILKLSGNKFGDYNRSLRYIEFGSAPMLDEDRKKIISLLPDVPLYNFYGSTESGRATVYNFNTKNYKPKCIGKPTHNSNLIVVDDERNEIQSSKENVGLLACSGTMCMIGYYQDDDETNKVMKNGYVYSNDEAYFDADGDIILLGRKGDVINIGGKKVSPEEIESIALEIDGVMDCGCISVKDTIAGNVPKLFVEMEDGCAFDEKQIRNYMSKKMEPFKIPQYIVVIDKIPRTYNGKLSRKELYKL